MSVNASIMRWDARRSVTAAALAAPLIAVGGPFTVQPRIIKFVNDTDQNVDVSVIGLAGNEVDIIPAYSMAVYDLTANTSHQAGYLVFNEGTQIYANAPVAPTVGSGSFYVVILYASEF